MNTLQVQPYGVEMATTEKIPFGFDTSNLLTGAQVPSGPTAVLTDITVTADIAGVPTPTIVGNIVTVEILGTLLTDEHIYELAITFDADASTRFTMVQKIVCVR